MKKIGFYAVLGLALLVSSTFNSAVFAQDTVPTAAPKEKEFKAQCLPTKNAAKIIEAIIKKTLAAEKKATSLRVRVKLVKSPVVIKKLSELPSSFEVVAGDSLEVTVKPSIDSGVIGVNCSGLYDALVSTSGRIDGKRIEAKSFTLKVRL